MSYRRTLAFSFSCALALAGAVAFAQPPEHRDEPHGEHHDAPHGGPQHAPEPHPGPQGYQRPHEPEGWNNRPKDFDRGAYQHNYQAARSFHIGPYHRPNGWRDHHWVYGEILPRAYWTPEYLIADYWLFALEVPPAGYEWVRAGSDAMLISTNDGSILQVEYGVFG
ncbi:MAG TPA: RcnB family protein [Magnetospirillaceae bacterium]|nr:RcnB family protein [Magnetospirillaceae bacterium]